MIVTYTQNLNQTVKTQKLSFFLYLLNSDYVQDQPLDGQSQYNKDTKARSRWLSILYQYSNISRIYYQYSKTTVYDSI